MGCRFETGTARNPFRSPYPQQGSGMGATQVPASSQTRASKTSRRSTDPSVPHDDASSGNTSPTLSDEVTVVTTDVETPVIYVNAKQFHRIMKRREMRQFLDLHFATSKRTTTYLHESRHQHTTRRPRCARGRFLNAATIAALDAQNVNENENENMNTNMDMDKEEDVSEEE